MNKLLTTVAFAAILGAFNFHADAATKRPLCNRNLPTENKLVDGNCSNAGTTASRGATIMIF